MYPTETPESPPFPKRKLIPFALAVLLILAGGVGLIFYRIKSVGKAPETPNIRNHNNNENGENNGQEGNSQKDSTEPDPESSDALLLIPKPPTGTAIASETEAQEETDEDQFIEPEDTSLISLRLGSKKLDPPHFLKGVNDKACCHQLSAVYHHYYPVTSLNSRCRDILNALVLPPNVVPTMGRLQYALNREVLDKLSVDILLKMKPKVFKANPLMGGDLQNLKNPIHVIVSRKDEFPPNCKLLKDCLDLVNSKH